jgi:putative inorganic carbon (HCO3(-)) transporter
MGSVSANFSKLNTKLVVVIASIAILLFAAVMAFITVLWGAAGGILLILAVVGPLTVYCIVRYPKFGVVFYLVAAYLIMYISGFPINFPFGTLMDATLGLLLLGFILNQKYRPNWIIFKDSITAIILIWIGYNVLQVANPFAESRQAWIYTIRSVAGVMFAYFIFSYQIRTVSFIRLIIKVWLFLSFIAALYALKQEYIGFFPYEQSKLDSDPLLQSLLYIDGHWRKNSIFSDPVSFAYNMAASSILCICLMVGPVSKKAKIVLGLLTLLFVDVMLFSGTRGAYVLLPAAMLLFAILKFNKQMLVFITLFGVGMLTLINMPTSNPNIARFQSAFRPSNDASYNVRAQNQKRIQPYIVSHPIGGGLGATGAWGVRFAPGSFLAQFPPDSGYIRVAVELGWIGLLLICSLMFIVLKRGINNYFAIQDPELKTYCLAMVLIIFALNIGNFPQEAIVQFPLNVYFFLFIAIINITYRLDKEKRAKQEEMNAGS